jgi:hypothetical protein
MPANCIKCGSKIEHEALCSTFDKGHYNEHDDEPEGFVSDESCMDPTYGTELLCINCLNEITRKGDEFTFKDVKACKVCGDLTVPVYTLKAYLEHPRHVAPHVKFGYCTMCGCDHVGDSI